MEDLRARARRGERGEADCAGGGHEDGEDPEQPEPEPEQRRGEGEAEVPDGAVRRDPHAAGHARDAAQPPRRLGAVAEGLRHQDESLRLQSRQGSTVRDTIVSFLPP